MPGGRPRIEIDLGKVERLAAQGLTQQQIADALGVSDQTLLNRKAESLDFLEAIKRGQAAGIEEVTNALFEQAVKEGNTTAAIFYLKNRAGWKDKAELTGEGGGPIRTETKVLQVVGVPTDADSSS